MTRARILIGSTSTSTYGRLHGRIRRRALSTSTLRLGESPTPTPPPGNGINPLAATGNAVPDPTPQTHLLTMFHIQRPDHGHPLRHRHTLYTSPVYGSRTMARRRRRHHRRPTTDEVQPAQDLHDRHVHRLHKPRPARQGRHGPTCPTRPQPRCAPSPFIPLPATRDHPARPHLGTTSRSFWTSTTSRTCRSWSSLTPTRIPPTAPTRASHTATPMRIFSGLPNETA